MRDGGYAMVAGPDGIKECATFTCCHCNSIIHIKPGMKAADMGGFCYQCSKPVCARCCTAGNCTPFEKTLERIEASYHARRSYGF